MKSLSILPLLLMIISINIFILIEVSNAKLLWAAPVRVDFDGPTIDHRQLLSTTTTRQEQSGTTWNKNNDKNDKSFMKISKSSWSIECATMAVTWNCQNNSDNDCKNTVKADILQEQKSVLDQLYAIFGKANVQILSRSFYIFNGIFVSITTTNNNNDNNNLQSLIQSQVDNIKSITPQVNYTMNIMATVEKMWDEPLVVGGGEPMLNSSCLTGKDVIVGILDSGIDYTHVALNGDGQSYEEAFGMSNNDIRNTIRGDLFPTSTVIEGYDFLGDQSNNATMMGEFAPDDDPIDILGHGTQVASAIIGVAKDVKFVAAKVCTTTDVRNSTCPDFALIAGMEFFLQQNVSIINLSLGSNYNSPYFDSVSKVMEQIIATYNIPIVTSSGNVGNNLPFGSGALSTTPNVISVGATNSLIWNVLETYSSRGPSLVNALIKPDLVAPSNIQLAQFGTGWFYRRVRGTSFSCPVVTGVIALLLEQYSNSISPFIIKCILMNSANRYIFHDQNQQHRASVPTIGAGQVRITSAITAPIYMYCIETVQPSISLGWIDVTDNISIARTIKVSSLTPRSTSWNITIDYVNPTKFQNGPVSISLSTTTVTLEECSNDDKFATIEVRFDIDATKAPSNHLTSTLNATLLDIHEFDGYIVFTSNGQDDDIELSIPFYMILRKVAQVEFVPKSVLLRPTKSNIFTLRNTGAEIAQIDSYELLFAGLDYPEGEYGTEEVSSDFRSVGYRIINGTTSHDGNNDDDNNNCEYVLEFAIQSWERSIHAGLTSLIVIVYPDDTDFVAIYTTLVPQRDECLLLYSDGTTKCTGFTPDHGGNTGTTIVRACSNDLNLNDNTPQFHVQFRSIAYPAIDSIIYTTPAILVDFPTPRVHAPSYDIYSGETIYNYKVHGDVSSDFVLGMQLVTNSYRTPTRTGAATRDSEVLLLIKKGHEKAIPQEVTPDLILQLPKATNLEEPTCQEWQELQQKCLYQDNDIDDIDDFSILSPEQTMSPELFSNNLDDSTYFLRQSSISSNNKNSQPTCPPNEIPRVNVPTHAPSATPSANPTGPTLQPSAVPTTMTPSSMPTMEHSDTPSSFPTSSGKRLYKTDVRVVLVFMFVLL